MSSKDNKTSKVLESELDDDTEKKNLEKLSKTNHTKIWSDKKSETSLF